MTDFIENLDIWVAEVKFEDSNKSKNRPVIIMDNRAYTVYQITSKIQREGYLIKDWRKAGLVVPSLIRIDRTIRLNDSDLKYRIGPMTKRDVVGFRKYLERNR